MKHSLLTEALKGNTSSFPTLVDLAGWAMGAALVILPVMAFAKAVAFPLDPIVVSLPLPVLPSNNAPMVEVDDRELDCLANNIYFESRNQSDIGMLAVGLVTLTRVESERWSDTVCGVVHARKQFTWTWDEKQYKGSKKNHADQMKYLQALNIASRILYGEFDNMKGMFAADHYHTKAVRPSWAKHMAKLAVIDDHIFYVDR